MVGMLRGLASGFGYPDLGVFEGSQPPGFE
jgi:hypothetical protein